MMKKFFRAIGNYFRTTDYWLISFCLVCSFLSVAMLTGLYMEGIIRSWSTVKMQIIATGLGLAGAIFLSKFDYRFIAKMWKLHVPLAWLLAILPLFIGKQRAGYENVDDRAWIELFGFNLQPSELLKISFIMSFAYHLSLVRENLNKPRTLFFLCLHGAAPVLLIHFQGDDGSALVFAAIFALMLFAAGLSWKYVALAVGAAVAAIPAIWFSDIMNSDQKMRFLAILFPDDPKYEAFVYQQNNGLISIGSGGVWGKGIFSGDHRYVPEMYNDFIFSFAGEAMGFVGCMAILALLSCICLKILFNSRRSLDALGRYVCVGVFAMYAVQSSINLGMNLSLLPVIGITLPFFSQGGSSVLASYLGLGLALSVYMYNNKGLFADNVGSA